MLKGCIRSLFDKRLFDKSLFDKRLFDKRLLDKSLFDRRLCIKSCVTTDINRENSDKDKSL